jgi:hypothetical protein
MIWLTASVASMRDPLGMMLQETVFSALARSKLIS